MKMKYILTSILACLILTIGCTKDEFNRLKEITVSQSSLGLPLEGGTNQITMTTTADWQITAEVGKEMPKWLTVSPLNGVAGKDIVVTFTAGETASSREVVLNVVVDGKIQNLIIKQASEDNKVVVSTVKEVQEGTDGKTYFVRGIIKKIENTVYGNWYLEDNTGSLYIYGTLDSKGGEKNFLSLGLAVGDEVLISGPRSVYNGTPQLKNVTVVEVKKSLLATDVTELVTESEKAQDLQLNVTCVNGGLDVIKGEGDWLSVKGIQAKGNNKFVVTISCTENTAYSPRTSKISIQYVGSQTVAPVDVTVKQGAVQPPKSTIKDATAMPKGTFVTIQGRVVAIGITSYIISDETGSMHIYKGAYKARLGDDLKIVGAIDFYNKGVQIQAPALEEKLGYGKVDHGTPTLIDGAAADALLPLESITIKYVEIQGSLSVSNGKYYNLNIPEAKTAVGSLYSLTDKQKETLDPLKGKNIKLKGYFVSISSSSGSPKFINVIMDTAEEVK